MLIFFYAILFTYFTAWIRWCVLKTQALPPVKNQKTFLLATLNPTFFGFKYIKVLEILSSWRLGSADAWPAWNKMLCMLYAHICMTDMKSLISFFLILFHYWAALLVYQKNRVNNTTSNSLINFFSGWVFSWPLTDRGAKMPTSIKSVTHILQWWNLAHLYLT